MPDDQPAPIGKILRDYPANLDGLPDPLKREDPVVREARAAYTPPPEIPQTERSFSVNGDSRKNEEVKPFKPFPFALKKSDGGGFRIWPGRLFSSINQLQFSAEGTFEDQTGIDIPKVDYPANLDVGPDHESTELAWNGDVYAYWETDASGLVTKFEIQGPGTPGTNPLPLDGTSGDEAKFYIKIGTVPAGAGEITQIVGSDIYWMGAFVDQESGSGSGSEGPGPSGGSSESSMGSGKDSGIVPSSLSKTGFVAWYAMESPDVRFEDVFVDLKVRGRESRYRIDPMFLDGIHTETLRVVGWAADGPQGLGFRVEGNVLVIVAHKDARRRPSVVNVKFTSIRKGFLGTRFTPMTRKQFDANERRLNLGNY